MTATSDVARDVVEYINDQTYATLFSAVYAWVPRFDLEDLEDIYVSVSPRSNIIENASRKSSMNEHAVVVIIAKRAIDDEVDDTVYDELDALSNEIKDSLTRMTLPNLKSVSWTQTTYDQIVIPQDIRENRQFTAVLTINFKEVTT